MKRTEALNLYTGPGVRFNPSYLTEETADGLNGFFLAVGGRAKPFEKNRNVHLLFELSPYFNSEFKGGNLRARLGLGYQFVRKNNKNPI